MTLEEHQSEVRKLSKLEMKLQTMILDKNDSELNTIFYKWQDQRNACNKGFISFISVTLDKP